MMGVAVAAIYIQVSRAYDPNVPYRPRQLPKLPEYLLQGFEE
jgi:hypothetical protein